MGSETAKSLMAGRIGRVIERSLRRAYGSFAVNQERYLRELRQGHGLPLRTFRDAFEIHPAALDQVAARTIAGTRRLAIVEGASFGLGGLLTLLPDVSILGVITFRLIQKLGLIYGFEFTTEEERAELWLAAASAAGVEAGRDWVKKQVIERLAARIAEKAGTELAEKLSAGIVPVVSAGLGATLNGYFINGWGRRAHGYFRDKHLEWRDRPAILAERVMPLLKE
ncbi:MAG TPA: EcsC family protein [Terriglobia bacterium]|nr:EcsC family protein [Terriglobia bacterium]